MKHHKVYGLRRSMRHLIQEFPQLKDIMQALADTKVSKIGLYGINGVGKTTLAREIARQAKEENLFDEVVVANVFQDQSMKELQGETDVQKVWVFNSILRRSAEEQQSFTND